MANNVASDGDDIFVTSATLTCQTTCVANEVPSTPCTNALLPAGAAACPLDCGACSTCPADTASTVVGSVAASDCVDANCGEYEYVGVDGTWCVLAPKCDTPLTPHDALWLSFVLTHARSCRMPNPVLPRSTAMVAQCDTLTCGTGYVLKSDAASLSCANYPCDVATSDKATCCEGAWL